MRIVTAVEGRHERTLDVAVTQAEGVTELVCRDLEEIGAAIAADGPPFGVVEVSVAAVHGEVRVRQSAAGAVEGIAVAVLAHLESDVDVNLKRFPDFFLMSSLLVAQCTGSALAHYWSCWECTGQYKVNIDH